MAAWILISAGKSLFAAFDQIAPGRSHASDGSIGDTAHAAEGNSDHLPDEDYPALRNKDADHLNEVHAVDVDSDLRTPGLSMEMVVQHILARCRSGAEQRLRYLIYNRRIWEASNGWKQRAYTGASAHTEHAHFSFSYITSLEASTVSWHLEDIPVALTDPDKVWIQQQIAAITGFDKPQDDGTPTSKIGRAALEQGIPNGTRPGAPRDQAWKVIEDLGAGLVALQGKVDKLTALVTSAAGK